MLHLIALSGGGQPTRPKTAEDELAAAEASLKEVQTRFNAVGRPASNTSKTPLHSVADANLMYKIPSTGSLALSIIFVNDNQRLACTLDDEGTELDPMNIGLVVGVVAAAAACVAAGAAVWGLQYAKGLIDTAVRDRQVDRVLALHNDFTTGEVGAARNRFGELMYRVGEEAFGPRKCWRPDWESLIPPNPTAPKEAKSTRFLGAYPEDMPSGVGHRPIHDLRRVLWCFDRINEARKRESSLDEQLLVSLMGHAVVWYRLLCGRLAPKEGAQLYSLVQLAEWMENQDWRSDPRNVHWKIPEDDFPGREDEVATPRLSVSGKAPSHKDVAARRPSHYEGAQ